MRNNIKYIILVIFIISSYSLFAQSGMSINEFQKKLEPFFANDLIADLKKQLPQGSEFSVWGWDVGDFSNDGFSDVAFTVKIRAEKQKILQVYLFVDVDGFLTKVGQFSYKYIEIPLEIGIYIKNEACYITKKRKQFHWSVTGYTFDNGTLVQLDNFTTEKINDYTRESYKNYLTLQNTEKFIPSGNELKRFYSSYLTIPSYNRGRIIYKGYSIDAESNYVEYVSKGAYYWTGTKDASFIVNSAYDEQYLYMTVKVRDDIVVPTRCDSCLGDFIEVWFDLSHNDLKDDRFIIHDEKKKLTFEEPLISGIYSFKVYPGNFYDQKAFIKELSTTDSLDADQNAAIKQIKAVSSIRPDGYELKFKIPFALFGLKETPVYPAKITEIGCTVILHDIDNEYRLEEETVISSSIFDSENPLTYGLLLLIPQDMWYGDASNIYKDDILKNLFELGF
jgi:hypothetical protein